MLKLALTLESMIVLVAAIYLIEQARSRREGYVGRVWLSLISAAIALLILVLTVHFAGIS